VFETRGLGADFLPFLFICIRDIKNAKQRAMKHGAESLTAVAQSLCIPLRDLVKGYKTELRRLHPFEKVVADLTMRARQKKDGMTLIDVLVSE
jgi:hypothetical protein